MMWQALYNSQVAGCALFDMKSALPSLFHFWLFMVVQRWNFPSFFINCIRAYYKRVWRSICTRGCEVGGFWALRGVKHVGPLSGILFDFA
eukprot:3916130-Pyramimonas_sp.AAC.1